MNYHLFNRETGEYMGTSKAQESPLEPGKFLMPPNATEIVPLEFKEGSVSVFNGKEWVQKLNKRGITWNTSTKEVKIITELDEDIAEGYTDKRPAMPNDKWTGISWETVQPEKIELTQEQLDANALQIKIDAKLREMALAELTKEGKI